MKNYAEAVAFAADNVRQAIVYAALSPGQSPKLGENMSGMDRAYFSTNPVHTALKRLKLVLFPWMVQNFRSAPTKTKAICIFDMFLVNGDQSDDNYSRLIGRMNTVRQDSELAKSMSWFKRVSTSSGRKVDAGIFDDMYRLHMLGSSTDSMFKAAHQELFGQIMRTPPRTSLNSELSAAVREIRQACEDAGFPLKKLGLSDSFA